MIRATARTPRSGHSPSAPTAPPSSGSRWVGPLPRALMALALVLAALPAHAQADPSDAERAEAARLKAEADAAYLAGRYAEALERLREAYRLDPDPRYVANQGLVHEQLGQYPEAVAALKQFLETGPPGDKASAARAVIERLEPEVRIETVPAGARVWIDGESGPRGVTPVVIRLVAGTHELVLELEGHARWQQPARVEPGNGLQVKAALAPLPAPLPPPPPEVRREFGLDGWGYVALGTAAAAAASGAVLYGLGTEAEQSRDAASTGSEWDAADRQVSTYATSSAVAGAVAGAALVTGVALLLWGDDDPALGLVPGARGGVIFGRF